MNSDLISNVEISELIIKVLTNQATPDECVILDGWVKKSDDNRRFFLRFRNTWLASSQVVIPDRARTFKALDIVSNRIKSSLTAELSAGEMNFTHSKKIIYLKYLKRAALWILLFGLGAVFSMLFNRPEGVLNHSSKVTVVAPRGSKAMTTLPDGSNVWLNAGSKIVYSMPDRKSIRRVNLSGEGYFTVARDHDRPFIVTAEGVLIEALGTEFNVKAYPDENIVETTLIEGSVSVELKNKTSGKIILKPNEQIAYYKPTSDRSENLLLTKGIDPSEFTLWINDRLQIKGVKLEDLAILLERKYDVKINFEDSSLKDLRFTGFLENETIEQIMEIIRISSSVDYRIKEREIWLMKTGK